MALTGSPRMEARRLVAPWKPAVHVHGQGQSDHPPRLRAVAGTAAINWRRWSDRSVTFSVPTASWSSVASCAEVTGRGWRAAITSSTACWRAVRWLAESRGREVLDGRRGGDAGASRDLRPQAMHRPLVVRRGSPRSLAAAPEPPPAGECECRFARKAGVMAAHARRLLVVQGSHAGLIGDAPARA